MGELLASNPLKSWQLSRRLDNKQSRSTPANLPSNYNMLTQNKLEHLETRVGDVQKCLSQMDTIIAFGPDGVSPRLLKEGAPVLCKLFNLSLSTSIFPKTWK